MPQENAGRARQLDAFLGWLLGRASQSACDANGDSRALRKRTAWCWNVRPVIPPPMVKHHTVMADGTYMNHGWCLVIAIDCVCSIESGPCERVESLQMSGRF